MSPEIIRLEESPGLDAQIFETHAPDGADIYGTIAIPTRDHINSGTFLSVMTTDFRFAGERVIERHILQGSILTLQRNELIRRMRGEWILFIDDDMVWQPDTVARLVATAESNDLDMVGALCFMRPEPHRPTLFMRQSEHHGLYNSLEEWTQGEIVEVDATGMAFTLIRTRVFSAIMGDEFPPFEYRIRDGGAPPNFFTWDGSLGEDLRFCQAAKAGGMRIFVDTGIEVGHVTEKTIGYRDYLIQVALRDEETYEARRLLNVPMGLPTMSPAKAREILGWR